MTEALHPVDRDVDGPAAPPRANGELVFEQQWEARAFGMAVSMHQQGLFEWDEFRDELIAEIGRWERANQEGSAEYRYYDRWLVALETLMAGKGFCDRDSLGTREAELAARPHGHDHA